MQAKELADLLELRATGLSTKQLCERTGLPSGTVGQWINVNRWKPCSLAVRASKMPGYAEHRQRIQTVAQALHMHEGEMPPVPTKIKQRLKATDLAAALEAFVAQDASAPAAGRKPRLTPIAQKLDISLNILSSWLTHDGRLTRPPKSVCNLPGFAEQADRIAAALEKLGQPELAESLRTGDVAHQRSLTVSLLVDVLNGCVQQPGRAVRQIATEHQLLSQTLGQAIGPGGVVRLNPEQLAALPGYDEHVMAFRRALKATGQTELATQLRPPAIDAAEFLQTCRKNFGALMEVTERMAADPSRRRADEATRVGLPPKLMPVLFDTQGALRPAEDVHERLRGVETFQRSSIADMLRRIAARHAGVVEAPLETSMKRVDLLYGTSTVPDRALIVQPESMDPGPHAPRRLERIYANSADLVRPPRSYAPDRPRQVLRWLSTMLKKQFPAGLEVQSYFDERSRKIVVATNSGAENAKLRRFLADGGLQRLLEAGASSSSDETAREVRHHSKLWRRMEVKPGTDPAEEVLAAIAESRFVVPKRLRSDNATYIQLHAERRIKAHLEEQDTALDPAQLAGTMRPCGTCASELDLPPEVHRGPFWQSKSAAAGVDNEALIERDQGRGAGTSITRTREGALSFAVDTDSDSDAEPAR